MRVLHIITALNFGGAETMLAKLLEEERRAPGDHVQAVLSLMRPGPAGDRIRRAGAAVYDCSLTRPRDLVRALKTMRHSIREFRPDVILAWMYHAQLAAVIGRFFFRPRAQILWNVRHSLQDIRHERLSTRALLRMTAILSRIPRAIIYNSSVAAEQYKAFGYAHDRSVVIPNGFDCDRFRPDLKARSRLGAEICASASSLLVGMVARRHPMKDHATLVRAAVEAIRRGVDLHLLLVGRGMTSPGPELREALDLLPTHRWTLREHEPDPATLLSGLDMLVLSSAWGEGFPNILGEAMACGVPCIATDVGDSRHILGKTGIIVSPRDSSALACALVRMAELPSAERRRWGQAARARVQEVFRIEEIASRYRILLEEVVATDGAALRRSSAGNHQLSVPA